MIAMKRVRGERRRGGCGEREGEREGWERDFRRLRFSQQEHLNTDVDKKDFFLYILLFLGSDMNK